jgi:hypothetical protein
MQSVILKDRIDAANELVKRLKWLKEDEEVQLEDKVKKQISGSCHGYPSRRYNYW